MYNNLAINEKSISDKITFDCEAVKRWKLLDSLAVFKCGQLEQYELEFDLFSAETCQFKECCEKKLERISDIRKRVSEIVEILWLELEEKKRQLDSDIPFLDNSRWDGSFGSSDSNRTAHPTQSGSQWISSQQITTQGILAKKQLRRRPNDVLNNLANGSSSISTTDQSSVGCTAYSEKKGRKRSPGAAHLCPLITQSLLPAQTIAEDVEKLCPMTINRHPSSSSWTSSKSSVASGASPLEGAELQNGNNSDNFGEQMVGTKDWLMLSGSNRITDGKELHNKRLINGNLRSKKHSRRVVLEFGKICLDGKTFHRGQNVFIKSSNNGWKSMQALVIQVNELTAQFRSSIPGDTRTVTATKEDLESGRVLIKKRY